MDTTINPRVLSASTMMGDTVRNSEGQDLGEIEELMLDLDEGRVAYAVLSFGGVFGLGDKLFAIPWEALSLRPDEHAFVLDVEKKTLEQAPGFDEDNWPETADRRWMTNLYDHYGYEPYW